MKLKAFTLLEVLVAISLFSVGVISVLQIFPVNRRFLTQSAQTTQAAYLAQEEIELLRSLPYANITVGSYEPLERMDTVSTSPYYQYQRQTTVSYLDTNWANSVTDQGLKKIDVTVSWAERAGNRQYSLTTYVYNK